MSRRAVNIVAALAFLASAEAAAEPIGFVQFRADLGVRILLEGRDVGVVKSDAGLVVRDVRPGARRFEARKRGYTPQFGVVLVEADAITVHRVDAWQPITRVKPPKPPPGYGTLIVETLPVDATIQARRLGWKGKAVKSDAPFVAREVPAGRHKFTFCNDAKCMDYWVKIPRSGVRKLLIDFEPGEIVDLTTDFVTGWRGAANKCGRGGDREACKLACEMDSQITPEVPSLACDFLNGGRGVVASSDDPASRTVPASAAFTPPDTCGIDQDAEPGYVTILSGEVVTLYIGDQVLGRTPLTRRMVPAGCHEITAVTADGKRHEMMIRIEPEKVRRIKLTL